MRNKLHLSATSAGTKKSGPPISAPFTSQLYPPAPLRNSKRWKQLLPALSTVTKKREPKNTEQSIIANPPPSDPSTSSINCVPPTLDPFIGAKRCVTCLSAPSIGTKKSRLPILAPSNDASPRLSATSTENNIGEPRILTAHSYDENSEPLILATCTYDEKSERLLLAESTYDKKIKPLILDTATYNKKGGLSILAASTDTKMNEPHILAPSTGTKKSEPIFATSNNKKRKLLTLAPSNTVKNKDPVNLAPSTASKKCKPIFSASNNKKRQSPILAPSSTVKKRGPVTLAPSTDAKKTEPCLSTPFARGKNTQPSLAAPLSSSKMCKHLLQATFTITENREPQKSDHPTRANPTPLDPSISTIKNDLAELGLHNFTCHRILGQGTYGKVMLVSHFASDHQLALKIVSKGPLWKKHPRTVLIEHQVLKMTRGFPFITCLFGFFQTENSLLFAMEYLSGGELCALIQTNSPFHLEKLRLITAEILCGLRYLHSKGIIHRDLKPNNILLDNAGHIRIANFGVAVTGVIGFRMVSGFAGTPRFLAPEIFLDQPYNWAVDYFSLGVMLFLMATGRHPFSSCFRMWKVTTCFHYPYYPPNMEPDLQDLIRTLLCKNQNARRGLLRNIRAHPFFHLINWPKLEAGKTRPPFSFSYNAGYTTVPQSD